MIKKFIRLAFIGMLLILTSCTIDPNAKIDECINNFAVSELATVEYTVEKIVKAEDVPFIKLGDKKMIYSMEAIIKAGIDMTKFNPEKGVFVNDKSITLRLPKPEILSMNIPQEKIKCEFQMVGTFRSNFDEEERNEIQKKGQASITNSIDDFGIKKDAEINAKTYFESTMKLLGFEIVRVIFE